MVNNCLKLLTNSGTSQELYQDISSYENGLLLSFLQSSVNSSVFLPKDEVSKEDWGGSRGCDLVNHRKVEHWSQNLGHWDADENRHFIIRNLNEMYHSGSVESQCVVSVNAA